VPQQEVHPLSIRGLGSIGNQVLMPEDLEKGMTTQDLVDLLEFLASLKANPPIPVR
jgi:hypothetical protein